MFGKHILRYQPLAMPENGIYGFYKTPRCLCLDCFCLLFFFPPQICSTQGLYKLRSGEKDLFSVGSKKIGEIDVQRMTFTFG